MSRIAGRKPAQPAGSLSLSFQDIESWDSSLPTKVHAYVDLGTLSGSARFMRTPSLCVGSLRVTLLPAFSKSFVKFED